MTKPESRTGSGATVDSESGQVIRRSTRTKAPSATNQNAPAPAAKAPPKAAKAKSKEEVVDSSEEDEPLTKKRSTSKSAPKKTQKPVAAQKASEMESEEEQEEGKKDDEEEEEEEEEEEDEDSDEPSESSSEDDLDSGSDFEEPPPMTKNTKTATSRKPRAKEDRIHVIRQRKAGSATKTPRAPKASTATKTSKSSRAGKKKSVARALLTDVDESEAEEEQSELYSAVLNSQIALDTVISDWADSYEESSSAAMLKLINFLIRCCGCKHFITAEDFEDKDNNVQTLENVLERYQANTANFDYPIVSKAKEFKRFKKNLLEFYTRLLHMASGDLLFDGVFMETLLSWTISLSSTPFRPVRHTATTAVLNVVSSLAEFAAEAQSELNTTNRQLATSQKQQAVQAKIRQLQKKVAEGQRRKNDILKWINEIFESVFVLRCRDVDPLVRTDCIQELGRWMEANQEQFVTSTYLPYLGWALSDRTAGVRLESLKVLAKLYEIDNQPNDLRQFTSRFTHRYIEMAIGEADIAARMGAIRVVTLVQKHGQLEEEDQVKLSTLIYGANPKIRKSMAKFVKARVWEDEVESRLAACQVLVNSSKGDKVEVKREWVELKSLVIFLIKVGKSDLESIERVDPRLIDETKVGRIALAVEALWSEIESLKNWKSMAEYLAMDHTVAPSNSSGNTKPKSLEDYYHLEEEEENVLLEIFVASLQLTVAPPNVPGFMRDKAKLKTQHDDLVNEVGRFCVGVLPQLFLKYSVDSSRIRSVLVIPQLMPLNVYVDMRMTTAYEELVDEVIKVFKKHTDSSVLHTAAVTLRTIQSCEILRASHEPKIDSLSSHVIDAFLIATANNAYLDESASDNDTLLELKLALNRLEQLIQGTDVTVYKPRVSEQDPYDALIKVIEQCKDVTGEHSDILVSALSVAFFWISWDCRNNSTKNGQDSDWSENDTTEVVHMQEALLRVSSNLAIKEGHAIDVRARRKAYQTIGDVYWLFGGDMFHPSKGTNRHRLFLACPEETQTECENFLRSEIELWGEKVQEKFQLLEEARKASMDDDQSQQNDDSDEEGSEEEAEIVSKEQWAASQIRQEEKHEMFSTVFSFMRQIMLGDFDMSHASAVIAQYGRFGNEFDEGVKRVVNSIKSQTAQSLVRATRQQKAEQFMVVCLDSLKESFENFVEGRVRSTVQVIQLAKVLTTVIKPPGFMQITKTGIDPKLIWNLQRQGVIYALEQIQSHREGRVEKKEIKSVKFFDVLGQMLFGIQSDVKEIAAVRELIEAECTGRDLTIDAGESMWDPLRQYQTKLEKLLAKAAAEQLAAEKKADAAAREQELDVDMQSVPDAEGRDTTTAAPPADDEDPTEKPVEHVIGKKRQVTPEEEEGEEGDSQNRHDNEEQRSTPSDNESESSFRSLTVKSKETKRMRVA
ncbi:hypothetical protein CPB97_010786 [Podila verticillata]|nr:hypothetical protein CPB97_010786 [Podila verticillata]